MPFLKLKYIHRGKSSKTKAKKALGYNCDKKKEEGRILFDQNGKPMTEEEALAKIVAAPKNVLFWKMILSPDVKTENIEKSLDLWLLTEKLVEYLKTKLNRDIPLIGAVHNNTDNPHVHAILLIERHGWEMLITRPMIKEMKSLAAGQALEQQNDRKRMKPLQQKRYGLNKFQPLVLLQKNQLSRP